MIIDDKTTKWVPGSWVDYLRVTVWTEEDRDLVLRYMVVDRLDGVDGGGANGYRRSKRYAGLTVYYDGSPDMGWSIDIPGEVCGRTRCGVGRILEMCAWGTARASRLDLCGHAPIGALRQFEKLARNGECAKYIRSWQVIEGSDGGKTVYAGSAKSDVRWRMYDKGAESGEARYGGIARLEAQHRGDAAASVAKLLGQGMSVHDMFVGRVAGTFKPRKWWNFFRGLSKSAKRVTIFRSGVPMSVQRLIRYVGKQLPSALRAFCEVCGDSALSDLIGSAGLSGRHAVMLDEWRLSTA